MALVGTYIHKERKESETEFEEYQMTHPEYPSDHPFFDKSGTTETIKEPKIEEVVQKYENIYLIVRAASAHQRMSAEGDKHLFVSGLISIYQDRDHKREDFLNELFHDVIDIDIESLSELNAYENAFDFVYDKIKSREGYELLKND
jgi:hypothetical protein